MHLHSVSAFALAIGALLTAAPTAIASDQEATGATLAAGRILEERCCFTASALSDGRVLVVGGLATADESYSRLATAEIWDPQRLDFESAGEMARPRSGHTAVLQPDGRVLVIGGTGPLAGTEDAELWDPATSSFTPAPPMRHPRGVGATVLPFADGRALIIGGARTNKDNPGPVLKAEVWDPTVEAFTEAGVLPRRVNRLEALALTDGGAILVDRYPREWLRWDPDRRRFDPAGRPTKPRDSTHRLVGGRVLTVGVTDPISCKHGRHNAATPDVEVWLPRQDSFRYAGAFRTPRRPASVTPLPDGGALFYGGWDAWCMDSTRFRSAEYWDPRSRTFTKAGRTAHGREEHTASALSDGRVAFIGGRIEKSSAGVDTVTDLIELWDPASRSFSRVGRLLEPRVLHMAIPLADGSVLVLGGGDVNDESLASAELWRPPPLAD